MGPEGGGAPDSLHDDDQVFAGVLVLKVGPQRQLPRPLSAVQQQYLMALEVASTYFTLPSG